MTPNSNRTIGTADLDFMIETKQLDHEFAHVDLLDVVMRHPLSGAPRKRVNSTLERGCAVEVALTLLDHGPTARESDVAGANGRYTRPTPSPERVIVGTTKSQLTRQHELGRRA